MTGFGNAIENDVLNLVIKGTAYARGPATEISLHFADPGDTGINELLNTGGSTYARKSCVGLWADAVNGESLLTANIPWLWLPGGPIPFLGLWNAAGDYIGSIASGLADPIQQFDSFLLQVGTKFTLD